MRSKNKIIVAVELNYLFEAENSNKPINEKILKIYYFKYIKFEIFKSYNIQFNYKKNTKNNYKTLIMIYV